jgi:hypothetical protein
MEMIFGRNVFGSASRLENPQYYNRYSEHCKTEYELGQRKPKKVVRDELGLTVMGDEESQDCILRPEDEQANDPNIAHNGTGGRSLRTDLITVSYEQRVPREENLTSQERRFV